MVQLLPLCKKCKKKRVSKIEFTICYNCFVSDVNKKKNKKFVPTTASETEVRYLSENDKCPDCNLFVSETNKSTHVCGKKVQKETEADYFKYLASLKVETVQKYRFGKSPGSYRSKY